jgi:hypothetical protein
MLGVRCAATMATFLAAAAARADGTKPIDVPEHDGTSGGFRGELGATPLLAAGLFPALGSGAAASMRFRWTGFSAALGARMLMSPDHQLTPNVLLSASMSMPTLDLCGHRGPLAACAVLDISELRVVSRRGLIIETRSQHASSIGVRAGAEWLFSEHLAAHAFVELHAQLGRPALWVNNVEAWRAQPVFVVVGLGLALPLGPL